MTVYFNNESINTDSLTLHAFMQEKNLLDKSGIAVAVNNAVVARESWLSANLQENDTILVITATQGG